MKAMLYYRSLLDAHDQKIYDLFVENWMHFSKGFRVPVPHCGLSGITESVHYDYPLLFGVDYYMIRYSTAGVFHHITGSYLYEKGEAEELLRSCEAYAKFVAGAAPVCGTAEKALWLHDVIIRNVAYNEDNMVRAHNVIGVIEDRKAVCEGIALTYKFLCDYMGIPCIYVLGKLNGENHSWNMIWLPEGPSFVDVTSDVTPEPGKYGRHSFLRKSSEMAGYSWDRDMIPESLVTNTSAPYRTAGSREELISVLRACRGKKNISVHLEFGRELSESEIRELLSGLRFTAACPFGELSFSEPLQMVYVDQ